MKLKLPLMLKHNKLSLYVYDAYSVDMDLYRRSDVFTIGLAFNEDESNRLVEKIYAISHVVGSEQSMKLAPNPLANAISIVISGQNLQVDPVQTGMQEVSKTNKLINIHVPSFKQFIRISTHKGTPEQKLIWELTQYLPPEYLDMCRDFLKGKITWEALCTMN